MNCGKPFIMQRAFSQTLCLNTRFCTYTSDLNTSGPLPINYTIANFEYARVCFTLGQFPCFFTHLLTGRKTILLSYRMQWWAIDICRQLIADAKWGIKDADRHVTPHSLNSNWQVCIRLTTLIPACVKILRPNQWLHKNCSCGSVGIIWYVFMLKFVITTIPA